MKSLELDDDMDCMSTSANDEDVLVIEMQSFELVDDLNRDCCEIDVDMFNSKGKSSERLVDDLNRDCCEIDVDMFNSKEKSSERLTVIKNHIFIDLLVYTHCRTIYSRIVYHFTCVKGN
jgi:hypothetical protein